MWNTIESGAQVFDHDAALREVTEQRDTLLYLLRTMVDALPAKRDWLDPDVENMARGITARAEGR